MQSNGVAPSWLQFLPYIFVVVILAIRFLRPQRISVTRMWIAPIILCAIAAMAIYGGQTLNPAPPWQLIAGIILGAAVGVPFGILRGMHTDVRPTEKPGVMYLGASWMTMVVFVAAFGLRFGIRTLMPHTGPMASVVGDGMLGFAISFIAISYVVIFRKYAPPLDRTPATR
jgi:hypothetical protein